VEVALDAEAAVSVQVYDLLGREVATLADGRIEAGTHTMMLDGRGLPSGVYVVRLETGAGTVQTQRVTLLR
ncbi:MAG: T9SS type A sorting domain-containing protein, partial [Bacteroidota bacterium]